MRTASSSERARLDLCVDLVVALILKVFKCEVFLNTLDMERCYSQQAI